MTIKFLDNGDTGEFFLEGRLDSNSAVEAEKILCDTINSRTFSKVVIDLDELQYVSSAGLRVFMKMHMGLKKKGGILAARNVPENIMSVFDMTGFGSLFKFE